jgi:hypothetical protein
MLTAEGRRCTLEALAGEVQGGTISVTDGSQQASAPIDEVSVQGEALIATATFGEDVGNFDWTSRSIVAEDGTVLDTQPDDHGRKAQGAVWTIDAGIELAVA